MFDSPGPRLFALPPGADFPRLLVEGLQARMAGQPPEALAGVTIFLNTTRMLRRVQSLLTDRGAHFLPRLRLVTDLGAEVPFADLPAAVAPLRRRLELSVLIDRLLTTDPSLAPRAALFDLADSLADLMDEMQGEGVAPETIAALDVSGHSAHWARTKAFLGIVSAYFDGTEAPDTAARQRLVIDRLLAAWQATPPQGPMIVAGSTGSRGATMRLMRAVAGLPQGAIVLPGFDFDLPGAVWQGMADPLTSEDHPQYRFRRLMETFGIPHDAVKPWMEGVKSPSPDRNRLVSLALRPAPVTDQWRVEGQHLPDLPDAVRDVTLIEAQGPREEALATAVALREAVEKGLTAALITPDRDLARRVTAALDRWGIRPDDSAGLPLAQSAPGRFLRQVAALAGARMTADMLLALLKHPLAFSGGDRGPHLRLVRELELHIRRHGPAFPSGAALIDWASRQRDAHAAPWAATIAAALSGAETVSDMALSGHVALHIARSEAFARGTAESGSGDLWAEEEGKEALKAVTDLRSCADAGGILSPQDYLSLFASIMKGEVRRAMTGHPQVMIWGTLEARVQGADLVILGGMTEGSWPAVPAPDPWLNRPMRKAAGLLLPERKIGLSAHDFQQAVAAPRVILSHAIRSADAETVPSRWLNRLMNLMSGLPERRGPEALNDMKARGARYLDWAAALDRPAHPEPAATRPSPRPPVSQRPRELSLTRVERLIRDPYAIYARYVLNLQPLQPLRAEADARLRGEVVHAILERFVKDRPEGEPPEAARARLLSIAATVLAEEVPWPAPRLFWQVRMEKAAADFLAAEAASGGRMLQVETKGKLTLHPLDFTLSGTPDRIDELPDGRLHLIDYKTGAPPSKVQQETYAKQLLLAAVMAERGGFAELGPREVARISYIGIKAGAPTVETIIEPAVLEEVWTRTLHLIGRYMTRAQGYTSRRAMFQTRSDGDYDHLARFGEWDAGTRPCPVNVGPEEEA